MLREHTLYNNIFNIVIINGEKFIETIFIAQIGNNDKNTIKS